MAAGLGLLSVPIVARSIGPDGRGETSAAIAVFYLVPLVLSLGIPTEIRRTAATGDFGPSLRAARQLCLWATLPATAIAAVLALTIFASFEPVARITATSGVVLTPLMMSWLCDNSILVANGRYRALFIFQLCQPVTYFLLVVVLWMIGYASTATVLMANILGTFSTFLLGFFLVRIPVGSPVASKVALLNRGFKFAGSAAAEAASNRLDQVLILPLLGAYNAGIYSVAVTIGSIPLTLGHALGATFFRPIAESAGVRQRKLMGSATRSGVAMGLMSCGLLGLIVPVAVPVVFGDEFAPAVPIIWTVLLGSVAMTAGYVCSTTLGAAGKGWRMTSAQVISLVLGVGLLYTLGPPFGAQGAALASSLAFAVLLGILVTSLNLPVRELVLRPKDFAASLSHLFKGPR